MAKTVRGLPLSCEVTSSDSRLDGTRRIEFNEDCFESGICVGWGPIEIIGTDGSWSGWWNEIDDEQDNTSFHNVLTGTGAHEGLTSVLFSLGVWEQFPDECGVIYLGDSPLVAAEPLAE